MLNFLIDLKLSIIRRLSLLDLVAAAHVSTLVLFISAIAITLILILALDLALDQINNVERRLGAAVPGVACVWASVLLAAVNYGAVDSTAGTCLGLTAVWITGERIVGQVSRVSLGFRELIRCPSLGHHQCVTISCTNLVLVF